MIYLDNAATSWPKPKEVIEAMSTFMHESGANPGRGGHVLAVQAGRQIYETREELANFFGIKDPARIVFTLNATESINLGIKGYLKPGDHAITTSMEHNAVIRPLKALENKGIEVSIVQCDEKGCLNPEEIKKEIKTNTKMIIMTHASNITGTLMPIKEVGSIAKGNGICFMVDAAQTAGVYPIDVGDVNIDLLAFPGHKSLLGPQGVGGLYIAPGIDLVPLKEGGTGSNSESPFQPEVLPDKYESGTPNSVGIVGLGAALKFIKKVGIDNIRKHEEDLTARFLVGIKEIPEIKIYGPENPVQQGAVVSINFIDTDSAEVGFILDRVFKVATRTGLHCAPLAHQTIGTMERGTVRFSFGYFNTMADVDGAILALQKIALELR